MAILAKRFGKTPAGWEEAAAPFSDDDPRSVADVDSPEALQKVREFKKAQKAAKKSKADAAGEGLTSFSCTTTEPEGGVMGDGQAPLDIGGFSHVCIGVSDMERSIAF